MRKEGLKVIAKNFIGTTVEWKKANPRLARSVWGFEETAGGGILAKIGDGKTRWNQLKYFDSDNIAGLPGLLQERNEAVDEIRERLTTLQEGLETEIAERQTGDEEALAAAAEVKEYADETKAPINAELEEEDGTDTDLSTGFVLPAPVQAILQRIWGKIRNVRNVIIENKTETDNHLLANDVNLEMIEQTLDGTKALKLTGDFLTRVLHGTTPVAKNLFESATVFAERKTLIHDGNGTMGVYIEDMDSATVNVETIAITPLAPNEPTLLGNVTHNIDLPLTLDAATARGWHTPKLDDYANVVSDETMGNQRIEWYVIAIDSDGNITWGNPVTINVADYQTQTTAQDAGKVLVGGATPGTHGVSLGIDVTPTPGSNNLINSHAVAQAISDHNDNIDSHSGGVQDETSSNTVPVGNFTIWGLSQAFRNLLKWLAERFNSNGTMSYTNLSGAPAIPAAGNINATPLNQTVIQGTEATFARSDHRHAIPELVHANQIICLLQPNKEAELAAKFGGAWFRAATRSINTNTNTNVGINDNPSIPVVVGMFSNGTIVTVGCCSTGSISSVRLVSSLRGTLETFFNPNFSHHNFNSVAAQSGEVFLVFFEGSGTLTVQWTPNSGGSFTEHVYLRLY